MIIFQEQKSVENGAVAVVLIDGQGIIIRKVARYKNGLSLIPLNPAYHPKFYTNDEINTLSILILGKVTEIRARLADIE
jgi:repressor LexA